jgi:hypothetical protein
MDGLLSMIMNDRRNHAIVAQLVQAFADNLSLRQFQGRINISHKLTFTP